MNRRNISRENYQTYLWFRQAAERGDAYAQFNLGLMYKKGDCIERDYARAFKWLR
ncbi:MAG: sel1 repeat family protein, partial [Massilia sp.]|nr:sel1 repeat family protein [Massilia sp.]